MRQGTLSEFLRSGEGVTRIGSLLNLSPVLIEVEAGVLGNSIALVANARAGHQPLALLARRRHRFRKTTESHVP